MKFAEALATTPRIIFGLADKRGQVGIEIEVPGGNVPEDGVRGWLAKREQSLRRGGMEYVYEAPGLLKNVVEKMGILRAHVLPRGPNMDDHVGSTHIHVNNTNTSWRNIFGQVIIFTAIEPLWMRLCGSRRDGNHFCIASYDSGDMFYYFKYLLKSIRLGEWMMLRPDRNGIARHGRGRYCAMNIESIGKFGSLEYRMFPSSLNPNEVHEWCQWCVNVQDLAEESKDPAFFDVLTMARDQPNDFATRILGEAAHKIPMKVRKELLSLGLQASSELALVLQQEIDG